MKENIFLDQSYIVVKENENYKDAVMKPVDEHGQLIDMSKMVEDEKKAVKYHSCYALSELLHIAKEEQFFIYPNHILGRSYLTLIFPFFLLFHPLIVI